MTDAAPQWIRENLGPLIIGALVTAIGYLANAKLDRIDLKLDEIREATQRQEVIIQRHETRIDRLDQDVDDLQDHIDRHDTYWHNQWQGAPSKRPNK
jgi:hypothetical protein